MSYHTNIEIGFADDQANLGAILDQARLYLEARPENYPDVDFVLEQFSAILEEEQGDLKGFWADDIEGLMEHVSAAFPGVVFYVRGIGEEYFDIWLRVFKDGEIAFQTGPFEDELDSALRRLGRG